MGRKSKILYFSVLIVNVLCFLLDLLPIKFPFFRISFAVSLILIGLLLIIRSVKLKIDSSMFIGITLFCCGILNFMLYFFQTYLGTDSNQFWPYYLFAVAIASLITAIYFKDKFQLKLFFLFLGFGIIVLLKLTLMYPIWLMVVLIIVWFVAYFIFNLIMFKRSGK